MKDSEREAIKLRANYFNSLAIVIMSLGGFAPFYTMLYAQEASWLKVVITLIFFVGAVIGSWDFHMIAQRQLRKLDGPEPQRQS